jgi:hypothetical protein
MGTQGATGLKEIVFGSNTAYIITEVTACPVLAVPRRAPLHTINKIVFATNYAGNTDIIKNLSSLADTLGATIQSLHIRTPEDPTNDSTIDKFKQNLINEALHTQFTFHEVAHKNLVEGLQPYVNLDSYMTKASQEQLPFTPLFPTGIP